MLLGLLGTGCGDRGAASGGQAGDGPHPTNAIIVLLDTLRADRLGCYGHERETSPVIDALAARGVRFERVVSPAPWTLPATGALLSGLPPGRCFDGDSKLTRSLIEDLAEAGFATAAFTEAAFVSSYFGIDRGFEVFEESGALRTVIAGRTVAGGTAGAGIGRTFAAARRWLAERDGRPFVLLLHSYEVHMPYTRRRWARDLPAGRFGETLAMADLRRMQRGQLLPTADELAYISALYDGGVRFADRHLGELLGTLDELGLTDETMIVVTSDHGEELGEHHPAFAADHGHSLKDELLLVPLIIADPTRRWPLSTVPWQVRLTDVLPTVLELLGLEPSRPVAGRSLVPLLSGEERAHRPAVSGHTKVGPPRLALGDGRFKLIVRDEGAVAPGPELRPAVPTVQLYDLQADPAELHDLAGERAELTRRMAAALLAWQRSQGEARVQLRPQAADEEVQRQLQQLGYTR